MRSRRWRYVCATLQSELGKVGERALFAERQATLEAARDELCRCLQGDFSGCAGEEQPVLPRTRPRCAGSAAGRRAAKANWRKRQQAIGELVAPVKTSLEKFEQQIQGIEKAAYRCLRHADRAGALDGRAQLAVARRNRQPGQSPARAADARPLGRAAAQARGRNGRHARPLRFLRAGKHVNTEEAACVPT
jgi:hypothetical protein